MNTLETTVEEILQGQPIPPQANLNSLVVQALKTHRHLPAPATVEVDGQRVVVRWPEPSATDRARAEALAEQAAQHAAEGRCKKAIRIWLQTVALQPTKVELWRNLGMASMELRRTDAARDYLHTALLLNPRDADTLVVLARFASEVEHDLEKGERIARRALAAAPDNPWALSCLGAVLAHTGRDAEAVPLFTAVVNAHPELASPYLSLAYTHLQCGRFHEALSWLKRLFGNANPQDIRCGPVFERAFQLTQLVESKLASQN